MKPIFLIALLLISSSESFDSIYSMLSWLFEHFALTYVIAVILADGDDNWSHFEEAVKAESAKLDENKDNELATRATFPCTPFPRSNPKPTSVHKLQPADIDVIAAIGDSLTVNHFFIQFKIEEEKLLIFSYSVRLPTVPELLS